MVGEICQTANPVVGVEVRVSPPAVAICPGAAPLAGGHVVVQVDVYLVAGQLGRDRIKDLSPTVSISQGTLSVLLLVVVPRVWWSAR